MVIYVFVHAIPGNSAGLLLSQVTRAENRLIQPPPAKQSNVNDTTIPSTKKDARIVLVKGKYFIPFGGGAGRAQQRCQYSVFQSFLYGQVSVGISDTHFKVIEVEIELILPFISAKQFLFQQSK